MGQPGTLALITALLDSTRGGDIVIGALGVRSITISQADAQCVIDRLPTSGTNNTIASGVNTTICNLPNSMLKKGRIRSTLITQTITLALNLRLDSFNDLGSLNLPPPYTPWLRTEGSDYINGICGDGDDIGDSTYSNHFIPPSVLAGMGSNGSNMTVMDLLALANIACADGALPSGVSRGDITKALGAYNDGFDEGRFFVGYFVIPPPKAATNDPALTERFDLYQNHPNPFNPSTTIEYFVSRPSTVYLSIYNSLGEEVAILENGFVEAGRHSVNWSSQNHGTALPSGVYTYRIHAEDETGLTFIKARRMLLVK
jgi:hypothetical protein